MATVTLTEPSGSSASSSLVDTVTVAVPLVGTATVREPVEAPKSPSWATVTLTWSGAAGAGSAVIVKLAAAPSVIPEPAVTLISGVAGGGSSSSDTATLAEPWAVDTV